MPRSISGRTPGWRLGIRLSIMHKQGFILDYGGGGGGGVWMKGAHDKYYEGAVMV